MSSDGPRCPSCGADVGAVQWDVHYCPFCGGRLARESDRLDRRETRAPDRTEDAAPEARARDAPDAGESGAPESLPAWLDAIRLDASIAAKERTLAHLEQELRPLEEQQAARAARARANRRRARIGWRAAILLLLGGGMVLLALVGLFAMDSSQCLTWLFGIVMAGGIIAQAWRSESSRQEEIAREQVRLERELEEVQGKVSHARGLIAGARRELDELRSMK